MHDLLDVSWDAVSGTAGGRRFGAALRALVEASGVDAERFAAGAGEAAESLEEVFGGERRVGPAVLARLAHALKLGPIEFMQKTALLSLEIYALGLDPLYFLPPGQVRFDARIYMREINPRHAVPERDMFVRNPVLKALAADEVLDALGKLEVQLTYLLRGAAQATGGRL